MSLATDPFIDVTNITAEIEESLSNELVVRPMAQQPPPNGRRSKVPATGIFGLRRLSKVLGGVHQKHKNKNRGSKLSFLESAFLEFQSLILKTPFGKFLS